jgi:hypothetical protein
MPESHLWVLLSEISDMETTHKVVDDSHSAAANHFVSLAFLSFFSTLLHSYVKVVLQGKMSNPLRTIYCQSEFWS